MAARRSRYEALWSRQLADFSAEQLRDATAVLARAEAVFVEIAAEADAAAQELAAAAGEAPSAGV